MTRLTELTALELEAMATTSKLAGQMSEIVGFGRTRDHDLNEIIHHIHIIQHAIMAQAAARAYPERLRLLGEVIEPQGEPE